MTIENKIKDIIEEASNCKYIGKLKVIHEDDLWMLLLYLDLEETPLVMAHQGDYEQFEDFIKSEVKARKLHMIKFWKCQEILPDYNKLYDEQRKGNWKD